MNIQVSLSEQQRALLLQMLEMERRNLPSEKRRTEFNVEADDQMRERIRMVDELIDRLRGDEVH